MELFIRWRTSETISQTNRLEETGIGWYSELKLARLRHSANQVDEVKYLYGNVYPGASITSSRGEQIIRYYILFEYYSNNKYSYSYSATNWDPNIIRIRIHPKILVRILFVFVFVQKFGSEYYSYSHSVILKIWKSFA